MSEKNIYTTQQLSEELGISVSTVLNYKNTEFKDELQTPLHFYKAEDQTLVWTGEGKSKFIELHLALKGGQNKLGEDLLLRRYEPLIEAVKERIEDLVDDVALPGIDSLFRDRILERLTQPLSKQECANLLNALGVSSCSKQDLKDFSK